jgi:hypothetical protein
MRPERARQLFVNKGSEKTWVVLRGQYELQTNRRKINRIHGWTCE